MQDYTIKRVSELTALTWEDFRFPATQTKRGSNDLPDFDDREIGLLFPQNDISEIVYFIAQMPHDYALGTNLRPHIHFIQTSSLLPVFELIYRWYDNGSVVPAYSSAISTKKIAVMDYVSGDTLQILSFPEIDGSHIKGVSSVLDIYMYRNDDIIKSDVLYKEFDLHYLRTVESSQVEFGKKDYRRYVDTSRLK